MKKNKFEENVSLLKSSNLDMVEIAIRELGRLKDERASWNVIAN